MDLNALRTKWMKLASGGWWRGEAADGAEVVTIIDAALSANLTPKVNHAIRLHLWMNHGHIGMYGDDGEMQCGACMAFGGCDFKRATFEEIFTWLRAASASRLAESMLKL